MFVKIKRLVFAVSLLLVSGLLQAATDTNLAQHLASINTLSADFAQYRIEKNDKVLIAQGKMQLQRPGLLRWEVIEPDVQIVVMNGSRIWNYDELLEQVTIQDLNNEQKNSPLLVLFTDAKKLVQEFVIKQSKNKSSIDYVLTPKKSNPDYKQITLGFAHDKLATMIVADQFEQTYEYKFSNVQYNQRIAAERFIFSTPSGVEVIGP